MTRFQIKVSKDDMIAACSFELNGGAQGELLQLGTMLANLIANKVDIELKPDNYLTVKDVRNKFKNFK